MSPLPCIYRRDRMALKSGIIFYTLTSYTAVARFEVEGEILWTRLHRSQIFIWNEELALSPTRAQPVYVVQHVSCTTAEAVSLRNTLANAHASKSSSLNDQYSVTSGGAATRIKRFPLTSFNGFCKNKTIEALQSSFNIYVDQ